MRLMPEFPIKCAACPATHNGGVSKAVDDGWHFSVFCITSQGRVQFAGCPEHATEYEQQMTNWLHERKETNRCQNQT